jgi:heme oxygenase
MAVAKISSPPSPSDEVTHSLSERINISTRSTHTQLNRLIMARLPLALPPFASNPSTYVSGLLHIAPIYLTFESLWQFILAPCLLKTPGSEAVQQSCDWEHTLSDLDEHAFLSNSQQLLLAHQAKTCSKTHIVLGFLPLQELLRSERLQSDIKTLSGTAEEEIKEQLHKISQSGIASNFIAHTTKAVISNPHVILAYTWVLYMALFSGGRYLRALLQKAGPAFWSKSPSHTTLDQSPKNAFPSERPRSFEEIDPSHIKSYLDRTKSSSESLAPGSTEGLQFFYFDGEEDGEDIKREFKKRFAEADILLSEGEKDDIVQEAQHIFIYMVEMVGELDRICGSADPNTDHAKKTEQAMVQDRDGNSITKESLSREQGSQPEEQDAPRPRFVPAASRTFRLRATSSTAKFREIGQSLRKVINPFSRRSSGAGQFMTRNEDQAPFGVLEFCIDDVKTASVFSLPVLILMFLVWYLI